MRISGLCGGLRGVTAVPGDKSISHRAVMLGALAEGKTVIEGFLAGEDCLATIECFRKMGVSIEQHGNTVKVQGVGLHGLREPAAALYAGNSGTTIRLLLGILAGQHFAATISGDASIQRRPMARVVIPLRQMGANISSEMAPLTVSPAETLAGFHYDMPIASAQVKSALLLAGLYAQDVTSVTEPVRARDHTEIMLQAFGVPVWRQGLTVAVTGGHCLKGHQIAVPGDISSAAFLIVAALIIPGSELVLRHIGINPTRTGILDVLLAMGADIQVAPYTTVGEPVADIVVRCSKLTGTIVAGKLIPRLIDEIPALTVAAAFASRTTVISDAAELKVKESNRIAAMVAGLTAMGADVEEQADGMVIRGGKPLTGAVIASAGDHRIAMSFAIAGLAAAGETVINGDDCIPVSFPGFSATLRELGATIATESD